MPTFRFTPSPELACSSELHVSALSSPTATEPAQVLLTQIQTDVDQEIVSQDLSATILKLHREQSGKQGNKASGVFAYDGQLYRFYSTLAQNQLTIWLEGQIYTLTLEEQNVRKRGAHGNTGTGSGNVKAPMPGTILQIKVAAGDTVEAGQALIIMESMKMEMTLSAPRSGIVSALHASPAQLVEMGTVLVEVTESTST